VGRNNGRRGAAPRANCWPAPALGTTVCRPRTPTSSRRFSSLLRDFAQGQLL